MSLSTLSSHQHNENNFGDAQMQYGSSPSTRGLSGLNHDHHHIGNTLNTTDHLQTPDQRTRRGQHLPSTADKVSEDAANGSHRKIITPVEMQKYFQSIK